MNTPNGFGFVLVKEFIVAGWNPVEGDVVPPPNEIIRVVIKTKDPRYYEFKYGMFLIDGDEQERAVRRGEVYEPWRTITDDAELCTLSNKLVRYWKEV